VNIIEISVQCFQKLQIVNSEVSTLQANASGTKEDIKIVKMGDFLERRFKKLR
jgi:hypothetical protein